MGMFWAGLALGSESFSEGTAEWSFSLGYGQNFSTDSEFGNVEEDIKFVPFLFSWGKVFHEFKWDGSVQYALEGVVSYASQEGKGRYMVGVTPLLALNFTNFRRWTPYVDIGLGIVATNLDPLGFGGDWGFTPQLGFGVRYALSDRQFLKFFYRYHHISNAGLQDSNKSIDSNMVFIGYSFLP